jgi:hemerythrin
MAIEWSERMSVGVALIDDQHRELIERINRLLAAAADRQAHGELPKLLGFLQDYVGTHFGAEEALMAKHHYPDTAAHKAEHVAFVADFVKLRGDLESQGPTAMLVIETQRRVVDWLLNHIGKVDRKLGGFLADKL